MQRRSLHTCQWLALLMGVLIFPASALANEAQSEPTPADSAEDTSAEDDASKDEAADDPVDDVIVVTGSRLEELQTKSAVRSTVIDSLSIEDSGAETLAELLEHYPGIQIDYSYRGGSVKIRGLSSKYVLILVDGRRQIGELGGDMDLERFPISQIERVEIVKGASSGLYGSRALGGVINIITRDSADEFEADVRLSGAWGAASSNHWGAAELPANLDLSTRLGVNRETWSSDFTGSFRQGRAIRFVPDSFSTTFPEFIEYSLGNKVQWEFSEGSILHLGGEYSRKNNEAKEESPPKETPFGPVIEQFDRKQTNESASFWLGYEQYEREEYKWLTESNFYLYRHQFLSDQVDSTDKDSYDESREILVELRSQYDYLSSKTHRFTVGTEVSLHTLEADRLELGELDRFTASVYAQDNWLWAGERNLEGALDIVPALRIDFDSQYGVHASPKVALRYEPIETMILRVALGSGFVAPGFKELGFLFENLSVGYKVLGNDELTPESSWDLDISAEYQILPWLWASVGVYGSILNNLITTIECPKELDPAYPAACAGELALSATGPVYAYRNVGKSRVLSAEASLKSKLGRYFTVALGYAHTDARGRFEDENGDSNWELLPGRALHRLTADIRLNLYRYGFRASLKGSYIDGRPTSRNDDSGAPVEADAYAILNARISQQLGGGFDIFVGVENIPNMFDAYDLVVRPRTVFAGVNGRF